MLLGCALPNNFDNLVLQWVILINGSEVDELQRALD